MSDQLDLGNYTAHHVEASELARPDLVVEELAYAAHQSIAFAQHHLAAAEAVAGTSAAVDSLVVAAGIGLAVAVVVEDRDHDCRAVAEAGRMHHRAEYSEVGSGHARRCVPERTPVSERRLE